MMTSLIWGQAPKHTFREYWESVATMLEVKLVPAVLCSLIQEF